jgi:hypothetical protein
MKKVLLIMLALTVVVGLALIVGCSDDDDEKLPTGPIAGDPDDPEFIMVNDIISNGILDNDAILLQLASLLALNTVKSDQTVPFKIAGPDQSLDSLDFTYSYSEFWHIFDVYARFVDTDVNPPDTLIYIGTDSIRFLSLEGPVQDYASAIGMDIVSHFDIDVIFEDGYALITTDAGFNLMATGIYTAVVSGTATDSLYLMATDADTVCEMSMTTTQTTSALELNTGDVDCPTGGSIVVDAGVEISCTADTASMDYSSSWHVVVTFGEGQVTLTYTSGNTIWTVTEPCNTKNSISGIAGAVRRVGEQL